MVGAVAMAAAARALMDAGMDAIHAHEHELIVHALERLTAIPGVTVYGETDPARASEKVGVIPFNLEGKSHYLVAAILGILFYLVIRVGELLVLRGRPGAGS